MFLALICVVLFTAAAQAQEARPAFSAAADDSQAGAAAATDSNGGEDVAIDRLARQRTPVAVPHGKLPRAVLRLPDGVERALVVDADDNRLLVVEAAGEDFRVVSDIYVAIGKAGPDKRIEGDEKTPIGAYFVTRHIEGRELPAIYGVGALPVNYPNAHDRLLGRTGSGIWLHGTDKDDATLMPRSSRGCLTVLNDDFDAIFAGVDVGLTPVIIGRGIEWASKAELRRERLAVETAIESWRKDWESRDAQRYLRHYATDFRSDGMSRAEWAAHKGRVNPSKRFIEVAIDQLGLLAYPGEPDLVVASFRQNYRSDNYERSRTKHQYWRRGSDGTWQIVWEGRP